MAKRTAGPVFEVVFQGKGISPAHIPLGTLSNALTAVQRLAIGKDLSVDEEGEGEEESQEDSIRLLSVKKGSAVYKFVGSARSLSLDHLRIVGNVLEAPETVGRNDYILNPLERLSAAARALRCNIIVRSPGKDGAVLARIGPDTFYQLSSLLFVKGVTSLAGEVKRVGGVTEIRCAIRVPFQDRLLFCRVQGNDVARKLGDCLYKRVTVHGEARWIKGTWKVVGFTITDVELLSAVPLRDALKELREAGGSDWDAIEDPEAFLREVTGQ